MSFSTLVGRTQELETIDRDAGRANRRERSGRTSRYFR